MDIAPGLERASEQVGDVQPERLGKFFQGWQCRGMPTSLDLPDCRPVDTRRLGETPQRVTLSLPKALEFLHGKRV